MSGKLCQTWFQYVKPLVILSIAKQVWSGGAGREIVVYKVKKKSVSQTFESSWSRFPSKRTLVMTQGQSLLSWSPPPRASSVIFPFHLFFTMQKCLIFCNTTTAGKPSWSSMQFPFCLQIEMFGYEIEDIPDTQRKEVRKKLEAIIRRGTEARYKAQLAARRNLPDTEACAEKLQLPK